MNLKEIMAIAGKPGLYKMIAQAKNGIVVESIIDHKRLQAFTHDKISTLEEISIYTEKEDMPLKEVLQRMYQFLDAKPAPDLKGDNNRIKDFFAQVLPEYDKDRVYISHMQKIINWYNILLDHDLIDITTESEQESTKGDDESKEVIDKADEEQLDPVAKKSISKEDNQ